jgi:hypothetical protein
MAQTSPKQNKAFVLEAFDTLFNKRDYTAAERFWSDRYIQHSAHIPPGREGLFGLVRNLPDALRYENQLIVAEGSSPMGASQDMGVPPHGSLIAARILTQSVRSTPAAVIDRMVSSL